MSHIEPSPHVLPFTGPELDAHPDRDRILATVLAGCDQRGPLASVFDIVYADVMDSPERRDELEEAADDGVKRGFEQALERVDTEITRHIGEHRGFEDIVSALQELAMDLTSMDSKT